MQISSGYTSFFTTIRGWQIFDVRNYNEDIYVAAHYCAGAANTNDVRDRCFKALHSWKRLESHERQSGKYQKRRAGVKKPMRDYFTVEPHIDQELKRGATIGRHSAD